MGRLEVLAVYLMVWSFSCVEGLADFKYGFRFQNVSYFAPGVQSFFLRNGVFQIYYYGANYTCVETKNFQNYTSNTVNFFVDPLIDVYGEMTYDPDNISKFFPDQNGGLIYLTRGKRRMSSDFGKTWTVVSWNPQFPFLLFQSFNIFYDRNLYRWVTIAYGGSGSTFFAGQNNFQNFLQSPSSFNNDFSEFVLMHESMTKKPVYVLFFDQDTSDTSSSKVTFCVIGQLEWGSPETQTNLIFTFTNNNIMAIDNIHESSGVSVVSDGEDVGQSRLLLTCLNNVYEALTTKLDPDLIFVSMFPRNVTVVMTANGNYKLIQTPATEFLGKMKCIRRISLSSEFKPVGSKTAISFYVKAHFKIVTANSTVGIYVKADQGNNNYTFMGYDDQNKISYVLRSQDTAVPIRKAQSYYLKKSYSPLAPQNGTVTIAALMDVVTFEVCFNDGETFYSGWELSNLNNNYFGVGCINGTTEVTRIKYHIVQ